MTRVIVFGSTGYLGSVLSQKLSEEKFTVKFMVHKKKTKLKQNEFFGDILQPKTILKNLRNNDVVVNLIGQYNNNLENFFDTNLKGALNLLEIVKTKKNIKIIFASSINVYGENCQTPSKETDEPNPITNYGLIKFLTEQVYHKFSNLYNIDITVLRFSNLYGKNKKSGIIQHIMQSSFDKPVLISQNGEQQRDFLYIDDAVNCIIQTIRNQPSKFEIFNICSCTKTNPKKIIKILKRLTKRNFFYKLTNKKFDEKCVFADYSKAKKFLNFKPTINIDEGITSILNNDK